MLSPIRVNELKDLIAATVKKVYAENQPQQTDPEQLMTRKETAEFLKVDLSTLWHWTKRDVLPAHGIGNRVYYKRSEILAALEQISAKKKGGEK